MKKIKDQELASLPDLMEEITKENIAQIRKWGIQERTPFEWLAYLGEEVGELNKAVSEEYYRDGKETAVFKEAIQVATLALKIAEMYVELP